MRVRKSTYKQLRNMGEKCGTTDVVWGMIPETGCVDRGEPRIWSVEDLTAENRSREGSGLPILFSQPLLRWLA